MVLHVLKDGTELASVEGLVVPRTAARLAYDVMSRMNERRCFDEAIKIKKQGAEGDHGGRDSDMDSCRLLSRQPVESPADSVRD